MADRARERERRDADLRAGFAQATGEAWIDAFAAMADGSESGAKAATKAVAATARSAITAAAASSAAQAYFSQAGIPVIGPVLAALAASAAFAIVSGFAQKMATGGTVRGRRPGVDDTLVVAQDDEEVLGVPEARRYRQARRDGTLYGGGGGGGGATTVVVAPTVRAFALPSKAEMQRWLNHSFKQPFEQAIRDRRIVVGR
jgi:hypothetical protein